ncbi:hypothetical protein [Candidatus Binatus sp.]|uniref:hypothetical protein n=1 Tax=Candidatus Binatus sp. TaxID=2811406 RepID=UPI002F949A83
MGIIDVIAKGTISNSVSRVAFGVQFITVKANVVEANRTLTTVLPDQYRMKITDEQDFIFQINRPHMSSKVGNITMNFLTKWSMERLQVVSMEIPVGGAPIPTPGGTSFAPHDVKVKDFIAASVRFDNNNVPTISLTSGQQSSLLLEGLTAVEAAQRKIGLNIEGF